jgi:hypothetical protein
MKKLIQQNKYFIIILGIITIASIVLFFVYKPYKKDNDLDLSKTMNAIKTLEAEDGPIIGRSPTKEEIFNSPYIRQIRIALNGYSDGSNTGIDELILEDKDSKDSLFNIDKSYIKSKFLVIDASDSDYGGVIAHIVFIDKPDMVFFTWIYKTDENTYSVRNLTKNTAINTQEGKKLIENYIKENLKYSL